MDILIALLVLFIFALATLGVFLPFLPGVPLAWAGMLAYALHTDFEAIAPQTLWIFLGLTIFTIIFDFVAPLIGAKRYKASRYGIIGSTLGLFLGVFVFGPFGIILGPMLGAFIGELFAGKHPETAMQSAAGAFLGFLAGSLIKLIVVLTMFGFFIVSLF